MTSLTRNVFVVVSSLNRVHLIVNPWTAVHQAPRSTEFSRQEYWDGLPFPSPGDLPDQRSNHVSCIGGQVLYHWDTREALPLWILLSKRAIWEKRFSIQRLINVLKTEGRRGKWETFSIYNPENLEGKSHSAALDLPHSQHLRLLAPQLNSLFSNSNRQMSTKSYHLELRQLSPPKVGQ